MRSIARRKFAVHGGATANSIPLPLITLAYNRRVAASELVSDPKGVLDLPAGYKYEIIEFSGDDMDDGYRVPARPDAMACFSGPDDTLILMRNHENNIGASGGPFKAHQDSPPEAYDPIGSGGVTRVVLDARTYERLSSNLVLCGTSRNCAGGSSPWGWLSCEENVAVNNRVRHGYVFLCPIDADSVQSPKRIDGYGRFNHEAVCIDPSTNYAYLTEARGDGCLYRFVPDNMNHPFMGTLQALEIVGQPEYDTSDMSDGDVLDVAWVDIDNPNPSGDVLRDEAHGKGAAIVVRGESIWFAEGHILFSSSSGGPTGNGQIFRLIDGDNPTLELVVRSTDTSVLAHADSLTIAPWGEVFVCEDSGGDNHIRRVNAMGEISAFARNAYSFSELCGVCFSPDGRAMFVNLPTDGLTLVITGPFPTIEKRKEEQERDDEAGECEGKSSGTEATEGR